MLKTFNVVEKYEDILPFLEEKKNQSSYICELIRRDMNNEYIDTNLEELRQEFGQYAPQVITESIKCIMREEIREEIKLEIRSEIRDFKRQLLEEIKDSLPNIEKQSTTNKAPAQLKQLVTGVSLF